MAKYRHGDVSFHQISKKEFEKLTKGKDCKKKGIDSFVVALGEVTGHKHVMTMERPKSLSLFDIQDGVLFNLGAKGVMTHEEHHPITLKPGFYVQKIERDFDPFSEQARRAMD